MANCKYVLLSYYLQYSIEGVLILELFEELVMRL